MQSPQNTVEVWRGPMLESLHRGHAMVCGDEGNIITDWGDPDTMIYPASVAELLAQFSDRKGVA